jgi:hypothetical protein
LQDELSGTENNTSVVFLHTTVDDGDYFQQILAWTPKSRWEVQNQSLREITGTFRSEKQTVVQIGEVGISGNDTNAPRNSTSNVRLFSSYPTASIAEEPSLTVVIQLIDRRGYMR